MLDDMAYSLEQDARRIEDSEIKELNEKLAEAKDKVAKLYKAAAILRGEQLKPRRRKPAKRKWNPRPETIQKVLEVFANMETEETLNVTQIAERSGLSTNTVTRIINRLREDEKIRAAGQNGKSGVMYAKMP